MNRFLAYAEAGQKAPPKRKIKMPRTLLLESAEHWALVPVEVVCSYNAKLTLGKSKKSTDLAFAGSCPL